MAKKGKKQEEMRSGNRSKRKARKDDSRPNYRRKKKERSKREGEKDKGIQI